MAKVMTKQRFETAVKNAVLDAENFIEQEVAPFRLKSWMYWQGRTDLPAQKNRSKVVMTEVSDTVEQTVPQMMDMLYSEDDAVAFSDDSGLDGQKFAWQATKLADYIFKVKNDGWTLTEDFVRDGLIAKTGIFKVHVRDKADVLQQEYAGLAPDEFALLAGTEDSEVQWTEVDPVTGTYSAGIRVMRTKPEYMIETIAPEDFLINRAATSTRNTDYRLVGEKRLMMVSDVVEMGIPFAKAKKYAGYEGSTYEEQEREQRQYRNLYRSDASNEDEATRTVIVYEIYTRVDKDGDGVAELHKILAIGDKCAYIHSDEVVTDHPYAVGTPYRVPHAVIGKSQADFTRDLQDINTQLMRQVLDNLSHVNNPRTEAVETQVNLKDLQDNKFAGIIRVRQPGMVKPHDVPFVAGQTMPIFDYLDKRKEQRTGISSESMALNAESLQSSSEVGVRAVIGAAQNQIKMMARSMCETGMKEMYRKLLSLIVTHQDEPMQIKVNGIPMTINPDDLRDRDFDITVHVGAGAGTRDEKMAHLQAIAAQQQTILQMAPENPFVLPSHYGYTLHKITAMAGCGPSDFYWKPLETMDQEMQQLLQKQAEAAQQNNPQAAQMAKVQADIQRDQQKLQADVQRDQAKLEHDKQSGMLKLQMDMQLQTMKMKQEAELALYKAQLEAQQDMSQHDLEVAIKSREMEMDAAFREAEIELEARLEKYRIDKDVQHQPANLPRAN